METTVVPVKGMTCMGCVSSVKRVLGNISGVSQAEVSHGDVLEHLRAVVVVLTRAMEPDGGERAARTP